MKKLVVHMIGNAHLDPVWLWQQTSGIDEALQTVRTACDLLDEYEGLYVTRGEAWVHKVVETMDSALWRRVERHARAGQWTVVNGWWIQPDCNLPTAESFRKHGQIGGDWFRRHLGVSPTVGYNVDSFGHNAMIPTFLRQAGMDSYCFMRPGRHEKEIPADLFTWRSVAGDEVTAFRIAHSYASRTIEQLRETLDESIRRANREAGHTMCFYGVGDHGGGPTREQINWILENLDYMEDVELTLSHPRAFFDAVKASRAELPSVTGELQMHAVGCYSVIHGLKKQMRRAEETALQAGHVVARWQDAAESGAEERLRDAWERILFNQFHDILAGSSIEPAYEDTRDQLGYARTVAGEIIVAATRKRVTALPAAAHQRMVLANLSDRRFQGYVEFEPWLEWRSDQALRLVDEEGNAVAAQRLSPGAAVNGLARLLFRTEIEPMKERIIEIRHDFSETLEPIAVIAGDMVQNDGVAATLSPDGIGGIKLKNPESRFLGNGEIRIAAYEDPSDTWSHDVRRYDWPLVGVFEETEGWSVLEEGALRVTMIKRLQLGESDCVMKIYVQAGEPIVRMRLRMHWKGALRIVKLLVPTGFAGGRRVDGCPGGEVERPMNGWEFPFHNYMVVSEPASAGTRAFALVTADAFASDVEESGLIRLTLLRSPAYAHHDPFVLPRQNYYPITDQGVHEYEIAFMPMRSLSRDAVLDEVNRQSRPVWVTETTKGMPGR